MSFSFEVHPDAEEFKDGMQKLDLEAVVEEDGQPADLLSEYEGLFDEEDFIALGINPSQPTEAKPGSDDKVLMLAARYAVGLPLWHDSDCYDHGPGRQILFQ